KWQRRRRPQRLGSVLPSAKYHMWAEPGGGSWAREGKAVTNTAIGTVDAARRTAVTNELSRLCSGFTVLNYSALPIPLSQRIRRPGSHGFLTPEGGPCSRDGPPSKARRSVVVRCRCGRRGCRRPQATLERAVGRARP